MNYTNRVGEGNEKIQVHQFFVMTGKHKNPRYGARSPVMSQAGAAPGPMPRGGPPHITRGQPCSRYVKVRQRKRNKEHKTRRKPDPPKKEQHQSCLNILQWNASAISNKRTELAHLLSERDIHVALIQESQHYSENPHITN